MALHFADSCCRAVAKCRCAVGAAVAPVRDTDEGGVGVGHLYAEELGSTRLHTHMRVCMCM